MPLLEILRSNSSAMEHSNWRNKVSLVMFLGERNMMEALPTQNNGGDIVKYANYLPPWFGIGIPEVNSRLRKFHISKKFLIYFLWIKVYRLNRFLYNKHPTYFFRKWNVDKCAILKIYYNTNFIINTNLRNRSWLSTQNIQDRTPRLMCWHEPPLLTLPLFSCHTFLPCQLEIGTSLVQYKVECVL